MEQKNAIKIDNALNRAQWRLSIAEQRIVLNAIASIPPDEDVSDDRLYEVSPADLVALGTNKKLVYDDCKVATRQLMHRVITLQSEDAKKRNTIRSFVWVQEIQYDNDAHKIFMRFSKPIIPFLSQLKRQFTQFNLYELKGISGAYSSRIYAMCMQFADRKILRISVTDLKERLGIADKYKLYSGLKRDVINPAVEEINNAENTRIRLKISEIKHGRAVAVIEFKITVINKVRRLAGNFVLTRGQARMMARRMLDLPNKDSFYKKVYQTVPGASLNGCEDRSQEVAKYEQELQKPEFAKALSEWLCAAGYEP